MLQVNNLIYLSNIPSTNTWISFRLMKVAELLLNLPLPLQTCLQILPGWLFVQEAPRACQLGLISPSQLFPPNNAFFPRKK